MKDGSGRKIEYLRVSVTDKCNLRCAYCMPKDGICSLSHGEILTFEEIVRLTRILADLGVRRVRLTGGEPTVRRDFTSLVREISLIPGIEEVVMTSNGLLLEEMAPALWEAGLKGVNISIDALDEEVYKEITGSCGVKKALGAMEKCLALGMKVKLNCVPVRGVNEEQLLSLAMLTKSYPVDVRFIELMPLGCGAAFKGIPSEEIKGILSAELKLKEDPCKEGVKGPATYVRGEGFPGRIGFISPMTGKFCESCNRIRITSDGFLKLCLYSSKGIPLRDLLRGGADDGKLKAAVAGAALQKPEGHFFGEEDPEREVKRMNEIGG